jgi:hypothetical protein
VCADVCAFREQYTFAEIDPGSQGNVEMRYKNEIKQTTWPLSAFQKEPLSREREKVECQPRGMTDQFHQHVKKK